MSDEKRQRGLMLTDVWVYEDGVVEACEGEESYVLLEELRDDVIGLVADAETVTCH